MTHDIKLSVFTPSHDATYLSAAYKSLVRQSMDVPFEWILVANGKLTIEQIPREIRQDKRVKIHHSTQTTIGGLKRFACDQCVGEVLVELDHDDFLAPDAFQQLVAASRQAPTAFYYSDFVTIRPDGRNELYGTRFGWTHYECELIGRTWTAHEAFKPTARALCQIYFAPNHIRAWSRVAYDKSGGHDPALSAGDDHDLVCRTYLAGVPFAHIQKPLYVYRRHAHNSFVAMNQDVQRQQHHNFENYLHKLIHEECRRKLLPVIEVTDDFLTNNYTMKERHNSVGCLKVTDLLHRIDIADVPRVMNEFYRVLAPGGWLLTQTPMKKDAASLWNGESFEKFCNRDQASLAPLYSGRFQSVRVLTGAGTDGDDYVLGDLCALKGQRQPGVQNI